MSISDSNLSRYDSYNTNMTVSVTESAINSQLRNYLASISTSEKQSNFQMKAYMLSYTGDDGKAVTVFIDKNTNEDKLPKGFPEDLYEKVKMLKEKGSSLYNEFEKLDLFDIRSGTSAVVDTKNPPEQSADAEKIQTAAGYYLRYGLFIEDGIPDSVLSKLLDEKDPSELDKILKPITLQSNTKNVLFDQFFRNICGIQLTTAASGTYPDLKIKITLSKSEQSGNDIWHFPFNISLDFRAVDYSVCGEEIQKKIQQMAEVANPDDVFNISQLALDLETLSTTVSPTIKDFEHDVDDFISSIIRSYFDRLEKAGQTMFGSVITTKPASTTKYIFTPKMRNYHIAPRTLDYLIGFGDAKTIPNLGNDNNLYWDTDSSPLINEGNPNNAAIAISSSYFLPFISDMIRPALKHLPNKIEVYADDPVWKDSFKVWSKCTPDDVETDFTIKETGDGIEFRYSYSYTDETSRHLMWQPPLPTPVASLKLKHKYNADVSGKSGSYDFDGTALPAFVFDFRIKGWLMIDYDTNKGTQGTYFDRTIRMAIGIRIDSQTGNIDFVKKIDNIDNHPSGIPQSWWVKFMTAQHIKDYVNTLVKYLTDILSDIEKYSIDDFIRAVNSQIGFVMPGNKTFTFVFDKPNGKVNAITPSGDLYMFGNYVQELA
ncbi:MAG: hypothetical protein NC320_00810 [Clostridium sp.]|nr:hypothetical protein [Clostridium sp.]MCM1546805.1 hypothetical protein [Ruminococcus sp.]